GGGGGRGRWPGEGGIGIGGNGRPRQATVAGAGCHHGGVRAGWQRVGGGGPQQPRATTRTSGGDAASATLRSVRLACWRFCSNRQTQASMALAAAAMRQRGGPRPGPRRYRAQGRKPATMSLRSDGKEVP